MGMLHLAVFVVGCVILAALAMKQRGTFLRRVGRFGLFLGSLLIVGSVFNGLWSCLIFGRLYFSTDYVFDFSPFWPITQKVIDAPFGDLRGQLFGVSLFQLQLVWLLFAAGTWTVTIILYRFIRRRLLVNKALLSKAIAPQYRSAVKWGAVQQTVTGILSAMVLDGGVVFRVWSLSVLAYWIGVILIVLRRPLSPTRLDILFIKYGFIPLFILDCWLSFSIWKF
jgi:hypothetical protein